MSSFVESTETILVVGATSGIGEALARKFHSAGKIVIITGRRQERLDEIASQLKNERIGTFAWDVTDLKNIKSTAEKITKTHSDINAVLFVSGIQRTTDFSKPESLDFGQIDLEITTNYTSYIHLIAAFLPYLSNKAEKSPWLGVVSSSLALLPMPRTPVYNGTKAALHQLILSARSQLEAAKSPVKIVELYPPAVKTELHDKKHQPDLSDDYPGMELEDYVNETWEGLVRGSIDIPAGDAKKAWEKIDAPRRELMQAQLKK